MDGWKDGWTADWWLTTSEVSLWVGTVLDPVVTLEKMILVVKVRPPGDCEHLGLLSSWGTVSRGLLCPAPPCCPPHPQPQRRRILPAWLLSVPAVFPFPQQEALSSWPLLHSPCLPVPGPGTGFFLPLASGSGPPACRRAVPAGAAPRSVGPECTPPLLCAVSSLGREEPWHQPQVSDCGSSPRGSWVRGWQSWGSGADHGCLSLSHLILTQPGREGEATSPISNKETEAPGPTTAVQEPRSG